ncbi:BMP family ABC transporter substrate-binding protein [Cryptosporangium aurantiacum]|uniref:Basic membrane protein A n=1 Tax=Cryptosporangium aurantiacum TaxID=134849 RepID=A0A1M7MN61_9ACTN|nr:BMP family ABC transporter substrate-binding protein [Cryptosporangium aurantiacum]SHM91916.1 basic membrane protein A [Cryptosporangium aurantiacum]
MRLSTRTTRIAVAAVCLVLTVASCSSDGDSVEYADVAVAATGSSGNADINGDGKVVISVLSPGNLDDNGYYESFIAKAAAFSERQGWKLERHGEIPADKALSRAKEICTKDKPDLVALGAAELVGAIPASKDPACGKAYWYVPAGEGITLQPQLAISKDFINEGLLAAGYANGLLMESKNLDKAGYITGPAEYGFTVNAAKAFIAGIRLVVPNAQLETSFLATFDDPKSAEVAAKKQLDEGIRVIYPYLGGATDAVAKAGNKFDAILSTPGTNRCDSTDPTFDISVIFDPGEYFAAALQDFAEGELVMGKEREWHLGVDTVPTVRLCNGTDLQNAKMAQFIADIGSGAINPNDEVTRLGSLELDR